MTDPQSPSAPTAGNLRSVIAGSSTPPPRKPAEHVADLKDLVVGYAKQETIDPLKNLGRYLAWGVGGAIALGVGSLLLLLGLLRGLQSIDVFQHAGEVNGGTWSFVPYLATAFAGFILIGLAVMAIMRDPKKSETTRSHP